MTFLEAFATFGEPLLRAQGVGAAPKRKIAIGNNCSQTVFFVGRRGHFDTLSGKYLEAFRPGGADD